MKLQAKAGGQFCAYDDSDAGEGLAIFFSQSSADVVRWRLDILARLDTGADLLVGTVYVSPPSATNIIGSLTRQVAAAICPGAKSWSVLAAPAESSQTAQNETADITLTSSKCCTAPVGATRVGERYGYTASSASPFAFTVLPGQTITRIRAHGVGAGSIQTGTGAPLIAVANGADVVLEPKAPIPPGTLITFTLTTAAIEFTESA